MLTYRDMPDQRTEYECIESFAFKINGKGRVITIKAGQVLWVTSSQIGSFQRGAIDMARKGGGCIGAGWPFTLEVISRYFKVMPS
jgi:hypothetical protein